MIVEPVPVAPAESGTLVCRSMRSRVAMRAGDLLIWSTLLPHGNGHNVSQRPRLAQYIAMHVTEEGNEAKRRVRINCWRNRLPPPHASFPGDPRKIEEQFGRPSSRRWAESCWG